jgi:hypothetical protein
MPVPKGRLKVAHAVLGFRFIARQVPQGRLKITQDPVRTQSRVNLYGTQMPAGDQQTNLILAGTNDVP